LLTSMRTRVPGFGGAPVGQASGRRKSIRTLTCARFGGHAREGTRINADLADSRGLGPESSSLLRRIRVPLFEGLANRALRPGGRPNGADGRTGVFAFPVPSQV